MNIPFKTARDFTQKKPVTDELEKKTNENMCYLYRLTTLIGLFSMLIRVLCLLQWGYLFFQRRWLQWGEHKLIAHNIVTGEEQNVSLHDNLTDFDGRLPHEIYQIVS
jgi:hypothetical protein